ncbi:MAG: low molecular weight protein-tyrosine-phosphatase [Pseudomonadota bacterium]
MSESHTPKLAVLFVCLGNICRSPMAEGALRAVAAKSGLDCIVDSAGTAGYHIGDAPDERAIVTARADGVDISGLRGRQLDLEDFYRFTHIFALDTANLEGIRARAPRDGSAKVALLMDTVEGKQGGSVKDPYYGDDDDFRQVWEEILIAVSAMTTRFESEGVQAEF